MSASKAMPEQDLGAAIATWPMVIGDDHVESSGGWLDVIDPGNGEVFARVPNAEQTEVDRAVATARQSFDDGRWRSKLSPDQRSRIMWQIANLLEEHAEELGDLESRNQGQSLAGATQSIAGTVARIFRYYAGALERLDGRATEVFRGTTRLHAYTRYEPVAVAGLIIPWNFPIVLMAWKLAPALAAGCSVVVKPAEETPLTALRVAELCVQAGVPAGIVNVITGVGEQAGAALAAHPDVDRISFTGSTETGRALIHAVAGNLKKLTLELGGKSPVLVFNDADIDKVIPAAANAIFANAGQVCTAGSRLLVHKELYDQVVGGVCQIAKDLKVGYRTQTDVDMGPLISAIHRERVDRYVKGGVAAGADIATGGGALPGPGYFYQPTVISNARQDTAIVQEEVFGPVLVVSPFAEESEAIQAANNSSYGLSASVWTQDIERAHRIARALKAGRVGLNVHAPGEVTMPTGGYKESGWGRDLGPHAPLQYMEEKAVYAAIRGCE